MKTSLSLVLLVLLALCACAKKETKVYPYRWVYMSNSLRDDSDIEEFRAVAKTCSEHGLNGILLSCGADQIDIRSAEYVSRLREIAGIADELGVEIIPSIFSIGYGGSALAHNRNLAAGIEVREALFVVKKGEARHAADPAVEIPNGGFEQYEEERVAGFSAPERLGQGVFRDQETFREGASALRFENPGDTTLEAPRLSTEVPVTPNRLYRLRLWVKSAGLDPSRPFGSGNLRLQATAPDGRPLEWININMPSTGDWVEVQEGFNSRDNERVEISVSSSRRQSGKIWIDDLRLEEIGLVNLLRRPGTPVTVRGEISGVLYEEGVDFAPLADSLLNFRFDHEGPSIQLLKGGRIKEGERLRVSFYHGTHVYDSQVTVCMSEPEVYDIWSRNARLILDNLEPSKYFLHMDEIRNGGHCKACKDRNIPMAQILGDCITRQVNIIREANPQAEVFIWSDMLDPNHNASDKRPYYYHVDENYYGSWNYVPKDLVIACWYFEKRRESLDHFSGLGYRTIAGAYYDADDLENPKGWLAALDQTPLASGIMYTTWLDKYELLGAFGDLVSGKE